MKRTASLLAALLLLATCLQAGHPLYDFEQAWQFEEWETGNASTQTFEPSTRFVTSGTNTIHFRAEASEFKPRLKVLVWDNDWERYEFVSFVLTNPTVHSYALQGFVGDGNGYTFWVNVPPLSSQRYTYRLKIPKFVRKNNVLDFALTASTTGEVEYYLDDIVLLTKDEDPALLAQDQDKKKKRDSYAEPVEQTQEALKTLRAEAVQKSADGIGAYFDGLGLNMPAAREALLAEAAELKKRIADPELSDAEAVEVVRDALRLTMTADRFKDVAEYVKQYQGNKEAGFVVGFSSPMHGVMPKHIKGDITIASETSVSLAGNEKEAVQLAVIPYAKPAKNVTVSASALTGPDGASIPAEQVQCDLMAFAKTPKTTSADIKYIGWYPDPIIRNPQPVDVRVGDIQTWWIRVRAVADQKPGLYKGTLTVSSDNGPAQTFGLNVEVYGFGLPLHAPIPTAITYGLNEGEAEKHASLLGGKERWNKELKYIHADFLADYLISYDNIYRGKTSKDRKEPSVDWELMKYLRDKGTLGPINFGLFYDSKDSSVAEYKLNYDEAKKLGVLDKCYIYGFDEQPSWAYGDIENASKKFKELYPEVLVMTTSQDHSYGFNSPMKTLSAWCPIISRYNPTLAEKAREEGRRVWWYTCCWPQHPYPNVFVDYPAIDNRAMMGWMTAKYKPDGYLYFHTTIWTKEDWETGITQYPYTNWHPFNFSNTNGDGSMVCIDKDARPIATIRLENYRDGLEDLAYVMILEHKLKLAAGDEKNAEWTKQAQACLDRVSELVRTRYDYSMDPAATYDYRKQIADLIMSSPIQDANPWKNGLSVWGLAGRPQRQ